MHHRFQLIVIVALSVGCARQEPLDTSTPVVAGPVANALNFSWMVEGQLGGLAAPGAYGDMVGDLAWLASEGVDLLITVNKYPPTDDELATVGLDHLWYPVDDGHAPTLDQLDDYVLNVQGAMADRGIGVHCTAGVGRTGTFLAAWLVWEGMVPPLAIDEVRRLRPGSIETMEQEQILFTFADHLQGN
jgi:atypical dual specificity phosphatase